MTVKPLYRLSQSNFRCGASWLCICSWHSPVQDVAVRVLIIPVMECLHTGTGPQVVTFHLHGWYMLGVFLLLAFTHLGHECQDLLSLCDGMHVCTD